MRPLRIALCYDLKSDYLAAGFAPADVMEFDEEETVAALERGLLQLGHSVEQGRTGGRAGRPARRRRAVGPRVQRRRRGARTLAGGAGAGPLRAVRSALHLLGPADLRRHPRQVAGQAGGARPRPADGPLRRWWSGRRTPRPWTSPFPSSSSRWPRGAARE